MVFSVCISRQFNSHICPALALLSRRQLQRTAFSRQPERTPQLLAIVGTVGVTSLNRFKGRPGRCLVGLARALFLATGGCVAASAATATRPQPPSTSSPPQHTAPGSAPRIPSSHPHYSTGAVSCLAAAAYHHPRQTPSGSSVTAVALSRLFRRRPLLPLVSVPAAPALRSLPPGPSAARTARA